MIKLFKISTLVCLLFIASSSFAGESVKKQSPLFKQLQKELWYNGVAPSYANAIANSGARAHKASASLKSFEKLEGLIKALSREKN